MIASAMNPAARSPMGIGNQAQIPLELNFGRSRIVSRLL